MTCRPNPPRLSAFVARLAVSREVWRETVLGDLLEEFETFAAGHGRLAAVRWYRREVLRLAAQSIASRFRAAIHALAVLFFIGDRPMTTFAHELRGARRSLLRRPGVTAAILLTLAIGLGVNAAIFSSIDFLLLKPFHFTDVDRLVMLSELSDSDPYPKESVSPANFLDLSRETRTLSGVAAYGWDEMNLSGGTRPERVSGFTTSQNFFSTLGVTPARGRFFAPDEFIRSQDHAIVLSDALWRTRFGADPNAIGTTVRIDGAPAIVVGIAPAGFDFPDGAEAWTPLTFDAKEQTNRSSRYLTVFGRIADGHTARDATAELTSLYAQIRAAHPDDFHGEWLSVMPFSHGMVDVGMPTILVLWQAAAAFVLLIGCTNIVNLLLVQGADRQHELALRLALGASRVRIVRQLLVESLTLAVVSVPGALAVGGLTLRIMKAAMPAALIRFVPGWDQMSINGEILMWTMLAALATGVIFGVLPAIQASRASVLGAVKSGGDAGRSGTAGRGRNRARKALVVAELALALPLLIASAMAVSSVQRFVTGAQGYDPNNVLRASVVLPDATYKDDAALRQGADRLVDELSRLPGVTSAALGSILPASGSNRMRDLDIDGRAIDKDHPLSVNFRIVSPKYFETLRIPILNGRAFGSQDRDNGQPVAIISQSLADKYFPNQQALGRRLKIQDMGDQWITVAGVSGDVIDDWFANRNVPTIYVAEDQAPTHSVNLILRTSADPGSLEPSVRRTIAGIDPDLPVYQVRTMNDALKERTTGLRFIGGLMAAFGLIALVLAAIGIYSVMAYYVTLRRKEMGVRLALGATAGDVLRMTLGQASRLSLTGIGVGALAALPLAKVLEHALFGTARADPATFLAVGATLFAAATLASIMPARDATKVDPATMLRE